VTQREGDIHGALELNANARATLAGAGLAREVARADHNRALMLGELADRSDPPDPVLLDEAADRALAAVAGLDRFRHMLPSAADRRALVLRTYPDMFTVAINACRRAGRIEECAALIERSRVQPVLAAPHDARGSFVEPAPVAARDADRAVGGLGPVVVLAAEAERLAGAGARWLGWWRRDADVLRSDVARSRAIVRGTPYTGAALELLTESLAVVGDRELQAAAGDVATATRLALWRALSGPLARDLERADALRDTFTRSQRADVAAVCDRLRNTDLDDVLCLLTEMLIGGDLASELVAGHADSGRRTPLVLAPPAMFGRVPWGLLPLVPLSAENDWRSVPRLLDVADLIVGLPVSLAAQAAHDAPPRATGTVLIADPTGDLRWARGLAIESEQRLGHGHVPALRDVVIDALRRNPRLLVVAGHVRPGAEHDPASAALLLPDGSGGVDPLTAYELASVGAADQCVLLGCDAAGAATGSEWTGIATAFVWAGARWVVTTTWPALEDRHAARSDSDLAAAVQRDGPTGLWSWQREQCARWRENPSDQVTLPYRWAGMILTGSGSPARA
jgi:hypothetical protein